MNELVKYQPITALELRKGIAANNAAMAVLTPVEKAVFLASISRPFMEYGDDELAVELARILPNIYRDTGYRNPGESDNGYLIMRLSGILKRYYAKLTLRDFRMAFEMCITGELDDYLPKGRDGQPERGHFQQFNADYVCRILNAYNGRRAAIMKKAFDAEPEREKKPDAREIAGIMARQKEIFFEVLNAYRDTGRFPDGMTAITELICCDVLAQAGLIGEIEVTADEQRAIWQRTINQYARMGNLGDIERLKRDGIEAGELQPKAYTLARRNALKRAIEGIIKNDIKLNL